MSSLVLYNTFFRVEFSFFLKVQRSYFRRIAPFPWSRFRFSFFKLKWKTKNKLQIWILMFGYFKNRKTTYFHVFCLNFSIETKIKTLFLISYFDLSKKRNGTLGTRILILVKINIWDLFWRANLSMNSFSYRDC